MLIAQSRTQQRRQWLAYLFGDARVEIQAASDDASFRSYFRLRCAAPPRGAMSGLASYILMDAPPAKENSQAFIAITTRLADAGLNVPEIVAADPQQGFLLLSDLGRHDYLRGLNPASADSLYGDALNALVRMQTHVDGADLAHYDAWILKSEMQLFTDWFLRRHLKLEPGPQLLTTLEHSFEFLIQACLEQPQVFVHRDYHSRNLMHTPAANPGILDYQDALYGPLCYDLVSLLRDVYIRWPEARIDIWLSRYHALACTAGLLNREDRPRLSRWFDLAGIQRHLKVAGIFTRLYYRDDKSRYLADLPLTLGYLLEVAGRYRELVPLRDALVTAGITAASEQATARCLQANT